MTTEKRPKPANAGAVTRMLGNAGMPIGREHKASRGTVRGGWSNFTEGVISEQGAIRTRTRHTGGPRGTHVYWSTHSEPTGYVLVDYQLGDRKARTLGREEIRALVAEKMAKVAEILTGKGFKVEIVDQGTDRVMAKVWREFEGEVVKW